MFHTVFQYDDVFKVKVFLQHLTDPELSQDYAKRIVNLINILVPEWSRETTNVSIEEWAYDTMNNAPRNDED